MTATRPGTGRGATRPEVDVHATPEPDPEPVDGAARSDPGSDALHVLTGRMVSFRFILASLRRTRRVWLAVALAGLLLGAGYHLVVPIKYNAAATLYLAHPAGSDSTVEAGNDLAILDTAAVADRAIERLGPTGKGLTPSALLGKAPATLTSDNVMTLAVSGPTSAAAVRRVNALATAYLAFRAHLFEAQNESFATATNKQIANLQTKIATLTSQIAALGTAGSSQQLDNLQAQRASATAAITGLQQTVQQESLTTLSVVNGSRVITPGTAVPTSLKKALAFDGLTGLAGCFGMAVGLIVVVSVLSDRLRRREDVATLVGAPVAVSIGALRHHILRRRSIRAMVERREPGLQVLAYHLKEAVTHGHHHTVMVVSADDPRVPAAAMTLAARTLAAPGQRVVLVDETRDRTVGRAFGVGAAGPSTRHLGVGGGPPVTLLVPSRPWEPGGDGGLPPEVARADAVFVIASVDPGTGAWHLRHWAPEAILAVTAGTAKARSVVALTELLGAAGISVPSAVLLGADPDDESAGLPAIEPPPVELRLGMLRPAPALST